MMRRGTLTLAEAAVRIGLGHTLQLATTGTYYSIQLKGYIDDLPSGLRSTP